MTSYNWSLFNSEITNLEKLEFPTVALYIGNLYLLLSQEQVKLGQNSASCQRVYEYSL